MQEHDRLTFTELYSEAQSLVQETARDSVMRGA